jgi:hypothetical protein
MTRSSSRDRPSGSPAPLFIHFACTNTTREAIEQDDTNFHSRLHARFADIALRLGTPGILVHLVVISTGGSHLARPGDSVLQDFLKELNGDDPEPIASSEVVGRRASPRLIMTNATL